MAPQPTFNIGLKIAREETYSVAPGGSTNAHWWQGGLWIPITTDGLPSLMDQQEVIFAAGHAGRRARNNRAPVQGRHWSGGGFDFPITEDFIGLLLFGALGTASTNSVPSTDFTLASVNPLNPAASNTIDLNSQPSDGGAILQFIITSTSDAGWISVSGVDAHGNGASEVISFSSAGSFYTRTSFSAIGPSSIVVYSDSEGSAQVYGFQYFEHTFSTNNTSNPTFAIERIGDPTAGNTASVGYMHTGMVVQELTLNTPAAQRDGLFTGNVTFEGNPTATSTATSLTAVSAVKVWPAWGLSTTRDNSNWFKVTNQSITISAGNRNYRAAAGVRNPQGAFNGPQEVTGSNDILVDDEEEFRRWQGASSQAVRYTWTTPHKLTSGQNQQLTASLLSLFLENVTLGEDDDALTLSADFRTIDDADAGLIKFQLINGVPGTAYGN